jgi:GNAT superfamily N-acetyltransferase
MEPDLDEVRRVLRVWALDAVAFARVLAGQDPSWGSEAFSLAGGQVVLCGPGLYVNRAIAAGLDGRLTDDDLDRLEARSAAVGVPPAVEVGPATHPTVRDQLSARGYVPDDRVAALRLTRRDDGVASGTGSGSGSGSGSGGGSDAGSWLVIEPAGGRLLPVWQETSAIGWGHTTVDARRASDAFARAASVVDGAGFVLARARDDGRPVGCASLTMRDGVATLGGMSTVPSERRRGVQAALIRHRLRVADAAGCDLVTSTAKPGGDSERNLRRHGFEPWFTITTLARAAPR